MYNFDLPNLRKHQVRKDLPNRPLILCFSLLLFFEQVFPCQASFLSRVLLFFHRSLFLWSGLRRRFSFFVGVEVDPRQPVPTFDDIPDYNKVVSVDGGTFDPEFEALVLKLQDIVHLDLIEPLLIRLHKHALGGAHTG